MQQYRIRAHRSGFTIVELLIVIVIIAILAIISIVAYNGIQQRAKNTQVISGVSMYQKALLQYAVINNSYPSGDGCLGANYPSNQCWNGPQGTWNVNASFDTQLASVMGGKPTLATSLFSIGIGTNMRAGALWQTSTRRITYYLQGTDQDCGIAGAVGANEGGVVTQCALTLPAP